MTALNISSLETWFGRHTSVDRCSTTYMKNKSLGWPSSASKNLGFANELKSWSKRVAELTFKDLKYGAEFDRAMISAGYIEFREPDVVAIMW